MVDRSKVQTRKGRRTEAGTGYKRDGDLAAQAEDFITITINETDSLIWVLHPALPGSSGSLTSRWNYGFCMRGEQLRRER